MTKALIGFFLLLSIVAYAVAIDVAQRKSAKQYEEKHGTQK
jgi:hypothetical protein